MLVRDPFSALRAMQKKSRLVSEGPRVESFCLLCVCSLGGWRQDVLGKQLMCECLYLYGAMLLLLERHLPGDVRERMVIAVMRHQPEVVQRGLGVKG